MLSGKDQTGRILSGDEVECLTAEAIIRKAKRNKSDLLVFESRPSRVMVHRPDAFTRKVLEDTSYDVLVM